MKLKYAFFIFLPLVIICCTDFKPPIVSLQKYHRIQMGMSYNQVVEIIGTHGNELSRNEMPGVPGVMPGIVTVMYMWQNSDGSNMNAMFQNNKLMNKAQFGLQ